MSFTLADPYIRSTGNGELMVRYPPHSFVVPSIIFRAILHDPAIYPDPNAFKPERFLNSDGSLRDDPVLISIFGYGKRICPGRHLVDSMLFIVVASLLSVFKIEKGNYTNGGLDAYPYTGFAIRYSRCTFLLVSYRLLRLTPVDDFPLVVRSLFLALSAQEIKWQKK